MGKSFKKRNDVAESAEPVGARSRIDVWVAGVLLAVVVFLTVLFASGVLRFGIEGPATYILYVLAGLLTAVLCYGILGSYGEISGSQYGFFVRLGGAIVAVVLVGGGGAAYEKYVRVPEFLSVRVFLYEGKRTSLVPVNGQLNLHLGNQIISVPIEANGSVLFQSIRSIHRGRQIDVSLASTTYELADAASAIIIDDEVPTYLEIRKKAAFSSPVEAQGKVRLEWVSARSDRLGFTDEYRSLDIELRGLTDTERPIPVDAKARLEVLRHGQPLKAVDLEVDGGMLDGRGALLAPGQPATFWARGRLDNDLVAILGGSFDMRLLLFYDRMLDPKETLFNIGPLPFNRTTLGFTD